jgi:hypothetical protein
VFCLTVVIFSAAHFFRAYVLFKETNFTFLRTARRHAEQSDGSQQHYQVGQSNNSQKACRAI